MKQQYAVQPEAVETYRVGSNTDVILRKNIEKTTIPAMEGEGSQEVYECDERQFRYPGIVYAIDVAKDFDAWWNYQPIKPDPPSPPAPYEELEARLASVEEQTTDLQLGVCEIFEMRTQ